MRTRRMLLLILAPLMLCAWGCQTNPATGRKQLIMLSDSELDAIGAQATLRERREVAREGDRRVECLARFGEAVCETHPVGLFARHATAGEYHVQRVAVADQSTQTDRAAVHEGHAPASAVHAERGVLGSDA